MNEKSEGSEKLDLAQKVKADLARKGVSIAQWSTANGLNTVLVYELLAGRKKGIRGQAHRAAVLLGLKSGLVIKQADVKSALADRPAHVPT